jgi:hypothetical protein
MNDRPPSRTGTERDAPDPRTGVAISTRLGGGGRGAGIVAGLIAIFVGVALIKPWPGPSAPRATPRITVAPATAATPDPLAELRLHCQEPLGWRIYSQELWATMTVRSWRSLRPAYGATGPLDLSIPIVPVGARIEGLGYCSPWTPDQRPPDTARVDGWAIVAPGRAAEGGNLGTPVATPISLQPLEPGWPSVLGALYGPPVNRFDPMIVETAGWPGGRYVFAIRAPGYERWWGVDLAPQAADPGASPAASPGAASP